MSRKKKFKRVLLCALLISLPLLSINKHNDDRLLALDNTDKMCIDLDTTYNIPNIDKLNQIILPDILKDSVKNELINEATKYIAKNTNKANENLPKLIVEYGLANNIDIIFMMAQTQLETIFGTLGAGRETSRKSLFGVASKKYNNYNDAIEDYCRILKKYYLTKNRNEQYLLRNYVTRSGSRYAENPNYEKELYLAYKSIKRNTNIKDLQEKYNSID